MGAERLLISAVLLGKDSSKVKASRLVREDFIHHKPEYTFVTENGVPSMAVFREQFPRFKVVKDVDPSDIPQLIDRVKQDKAKHDLTVVLQKGVDDLDKKNPIDLAYRIARDMDLIQVKNNVTRDIDIIAHPESIIRELRSRIRARKNGNTVGIPTGIPTLDTETGGLNNADLWTVVGRTGNGKTWFSVEMSAHAYINGRKVLFISLEMPPELIGFRFHTTVYAKLYPKKQNKFPNLGLMMGEGVSLKQYRKFTDHLRNNIKHGFIVPAIGQHFNFNVQTVSAKIEEHKPDLVVVDYIGLMASADKKGIDNWQEIGQQMRELKLLALRHHIPIIVNAQANRSAAGNDKAAELHQISLSDAIGSHSDRVLSLVLRADKLLTIRVIKNRNGKQNFDIDCKWDVNHGTITELPPRKKLLKEDE